MTTELNYLAYVAMLTAALWIPYIVLGFLVARISAVIRYTQSQLLLVCCIIFLIGLITGLRTDSNAMLKTIFFMPAPIILLFIVAKWKVSWRPTRTKPDTIKTPRAIQADIVRSRVHGLDGWLSAPAGPAARP